MTKLYESVLGLFEQADVVDMTKLRNPAKIDIVINGAATIKCYYQEDGAWVEFYSTTSTSSVCCPIADTIKIEQVAGSSTTSSFSILQQPQNMQLIGAIHDPVTGVISLSGFEAALGLSYENTWVGAGDSTMDIMGGPNFTGHANSDRASYVLATAMLGGRLSCLYNGGVAGDTTAALLARIVAGEFEPYRGKARFVALKIGVNDASTGVDFATVTRPNLDKIAAYFAGFAEYFVWHTNTPYGYNSTIAKAAAKIADYIRWKSAQIQSCLVIDTYNLLLDKTATTGGIAAAYGRASEAPNYMHPSPAGARVEANEIVSKIGPLLTGSNEVFANNANTFANWGADASQLMSNPLCVTNGGTISGNVTSAGAGGLAGAPLDWTVRETGTAGITVGTCQLAARSDGRGNDIVLTMSAGSVAGNPAYELLSGTYHTNVTAGQTVQAEVTINTGVLANIDKLIIYLGVNDGKGGRNEYALVHDTDVPALNNLADAVFRTKPIKLVGTITGLRLRADIRGLNKDMAGVIKFGAPCIRLSRNF